MTETRVYLVRWDVERFQAYLYDLPDEELSFHQHMEFGGRAVLECWEPLPIYSDQPLLERPDIRYHTATHLPVMSGAIANKLEPFLSASGELLPLVVSETQETVYMLNVLRVLNVLEPGSLSLDDETFYPRFIEHRLPDSGFFLTSESFADLFYVERNDDEELLTRRIEELGLRGMDLLPVWSSSEGPAPVNLIEPIPIPPATHIPPEE